MTKWLGMLWIEMSQKHDGMININCLWSYRESGLTVTFSLLSERPANHVVLYREILCLLKRKVSTFLWGPPRNPLHVHAWLQSVVLYWPCSCPLLPIRMIDIVTKVLLRDIDHQCFIIVARHDVGKLECSHLQTDKWAQSLSDRKEPGKRDWGLSMGTWDKSSAIGHCRRKEKPSVANRYN